MKPSATVLCYAVLWPADCAAEEWRHLAGMHADKGSVLALILGAVVLAPVTEVRHMPCKHVDHML